MDEPIEMIDTLIEYFEDNLKIWDAGYYSWDKVTLTLYVEDIPTIITALEVYKDMFMEENDEESKEERQEES